MTNKEAAKVLITKLYYTRKKGLAVCEDYADEFLDAICVALSALLKQEEKTDCKCSEKRKKFVWHDAKKEPPKLNGYYLAKTPTDDCVHRVCLCADGEWFSEISNKLILENVVKWADYN